MRLRAFSVCRALLCVVVFAAAFTLAPSSAWCAKLGGVEAQGGTSSQEAAEQAETDNHAATNTQTEAGNQAGAESQAVANSQTEASSQTAANRQADADSGRYIKVLGVDAENLHLEVDGKTLDIPLPDGYEPMVPEEYPYTYRAFIKQVQEDDGIPLCALVNSQDHTKRKADRNAKLTWTCYLEIADVYIPQRFSEQEFIKRIEQIKRIDEKLWISMDEQLKEMQRPRLKHTYIYEDTKSIALLRVEDAPSGDRDYRSGVSFIDILIDNIAVCVRFYKKIYTETDIDDLKNTSLSYVHKINNR